MRFFKLFQWLVALSFTTLAPLAFAQKLAPLPANEVMRTHQHTPVPVALSPDG